MLVFQKHELTNLMVTTFHYQNHTTKYFIQLFHMRSKVELVKHGRTSSELLCNGIEI